MAKKSAAKSAESQINDEEAHLLGVCEQLTSAKEIAGKLFGVNPPVEVVFGVYDRLITDAETDEDRAQDLLRAQAACKELFSTATPTSEMVFEVFDRLFEDDDEDKDKE